MTNLSPPISFIRAGRGTERAYERVEVPFSEMLHFHADQKYVTATSIDGHEYTIDTPLKELAATYGDKVVMPHRAYLVVSEHIDSVMWSHRENKGVVRLQNGSTLPVSRRCRKAATAVSRINREGAQHEAT